MQSLVRDLLSYARLSKSDSVLDRIDCNGLVAAVEHDLQVSLREAGGRVVREALPVIRGHRAQLGLVFQNLIANAIKFHGDAPPEVKISAERVETAWRFAVRDNGIGFSMEFATRVFEPFQRLHTRRQYDGSGIGLAICKRVIDLHGGRIWVESEPGAGTTFYFTLEDLQPLEHLQPHLPPASHAV